jgi:hypothetical protein
VAAAILVLIWGYFAFDLCQKAEHQDFLSGVSAGFVAVNSSFGVSSRWIEMLISFQGFNFVMR